MFAFCSSTTVRSDREESFQCFSLLMLRIVELLKLSHNDSLLISHLKIFSQNARDFLSDNSTSNVLYFSTREELSQHSTFF